MRQRQCHAACPLHGHWCDSSLPHLNHQSAEFCGCRWDDYGDCIIGGLKAQPVESTFINIELPEGGENMSGWKFHFGGWKFHFVGTPDEIETRLDAMSFGSDKSGQLAKTYVIEAIREMTRPYVSVTMAGEAGSHLDITVIGYGDLAEATDRHQQRVTDMEERLRTRQEEAA